MQFSKIVAAIISFAAVVSAELMFTVQSIQPLQAGQKVTLTWTGGGDNVNLQLRYGDPKALDPGTAIATNLKNTGSYTWTVPSDVVSRSNYALQITDSSNSADTNYIGGVTIAGGSGVDTSSAGDSTMTETATTHVTTTAMTMVTATGSPNATTSTGNSSSTATSTDASKTTSKGSKSSSATATGTVAAPNSLGTVAQSSTLAMVLCVLGAVVYLN